MENGRQIAGMENDKQLKEMYDSLVTSVLRFCY